MSCPEYGVLILAAGKSTRFGSQKLLADIQGKAMILHTIHAVASAGLAYRVMLDNPQLQQLLLRHKIPFHQSKHAHQGMGATLAEGIGHCSHWAGCLITLADMPFIQAQTYKKIHTRLQQADIIVPLYKNRQGHPVGFQSQFFRHLQQLDGDCGAKSILQQYASSVTFIDCQDQGIIKDIDTEEDLHSIKPWYSKLNQ